MLTREPKYLQKIREVDTWLLEQTIPDIFDDGDPRNVLVVARQNFIKLCAGLTENGFTAPEQLTLVAFHAAVDHLSAKHHKGQAH